jgi:hypothetical protein
MFRPLQWPLDDDTAWQNVRSRSWKSFHVFDPDQKEEREWGKLFTRVNARDPLQTLVQ